MKNILEYLTNLWYAIINKNRYYRDGDNMDRIKNKLERKANTILVNNDMLKLPVDLIKIADSYNIDVYYKKMPEGVSGAIKFDNDENKFKILLSDSEPKIRTRFTLAHELAHYFLTQKELKENNEMFIETLYRKSGNNEYEVDYFASALLMDKQMVESAYRMVKSISTLAKIFEVSESVMTSRLMELGLI